MDDDENIRMGLRNTIDWETIGVGEVFLASNGAEALKLMANHRIHIVITDVEMPIMDGIELSKNVSESYPDIQILMVSAHSSFEYARSAMHYGVINYLLKPIGIDELMIELQKMIKEVKKINQYYLQEEKAHKYTKILMEEKLKGLFQGMSCDAKEMDEIFNFYGIPRFSYYLISVTPLNKGEETVEIELPKEVQTITLNFDGEQYIIMFTTQWEQKDVLGYLNEKYHNPSSMIAVSRNCKLLDQISTAKNQVDVVRNYLFRTNEYITGYNKDMGTVSKSTSNVLLKKLIQEANLKHKVDEAIINKFKRIIQENDLSTEEIKKSIKEFLGIILRGSLNKGIYTRVNGEYERVIQIVEKSNRLEQGLLYLNQFNAFVLDQTSKSSITSKQRLVNDMREYINAHYSEEIGVKYLSDIIGRSPNYLSHLFSDACGKTLSEYINTVRVDHAKRLLIESDETLYSISKDVGYKDDKYFIKIFKKLNGMTPTQYRALLKSCI